MEPSAETKMSRVQVGRHVAETESIRERLQAVDWDFPEAMDDGIHAIHPYPAKFISHIPRSLIRALGVPPGTSIFDPFCGGGTTLVVAQELGYPSIGVDLNPIACLLSEVKTSPLPAGLSRAAAEVVDHARVDAAAVPEIPNLNHWFSKEARLAIASLLVGIDRIQDLSIRDHLRLALSSIIVRVSNQESDTRYAAIEKDVTVRSVCQHFLSACSRLVEAKNDRSSTESATVIQSDILAVAPDAIQSPISLVVTSPPYPNAYEYWLYHKYRMWWLGFDPLAVKEQEIGARAHYFRKRHATFEDFRAQMKRVFELFSRVLIPGGFACILIGRSRIHGVDYDNASMIADAGESFGLRTVARLPRTIRATRKSFNLAHARIKTEELVILQKAM